MKYYKTIEKNKFLIDSGFKYSFKNDVYINVCSKLILSKQYMLESTLEKIAKLCNRPMAWDGQEWEWVFINYPDSLVRHTILTELSLMDI